MEDGKYNGWTNYETWCVSLWLGNTEAQYRDVQRLARTAWRSAPRSQEVTVWNWSREDAARSYLAKAIRAYIENENPSEAASLFTDLTNAALAEVNWPEIADEYLAEAREQLETEQGDPA